MREITFPESGAKRKLLEAAEQLFAEKGFEAVSVRDITQLAKANVAAVNYHFGSRENLLTMVMTRYMTPVNEERSARLGALERKWSGKAAPLEEIVEALVRPVVGQVRKSELSERLFYKLMGRTFAQQGDGLPPQIEEQLRNVEQRFTRAFAKALPAVNPDDLAWRIHFMVGGMIHLLTHGAASTPPMDSIVSRFIRFSAAGLREGVEVEAPPPLGPQVMFDF